MQQRSSQTPHFSGRQLVPETYWVCRQLCVYPFRPSQTDFPTDFLETESLAEGSTRKVHISSLWGVLIEGLAPIWPGRLSIGGISLGDVWPCTVLKATAVNEGDELVPFHKLTGWMTYSLLEPIEKVMSWKFEGIEEMTGLPEYRNGRLSAGLSTIRTGTQLIYTLTGGLLLDLGVLSIKPNSIPQSFYPDSKSDIPRLPPSHPAIVEWRAMTVIELRVTPFFVLYRC